MHTFQPLIRIHTRTLVLMRVQYLTYLIDSECTDELAAIRPLSVGQAGRISGVSPADISILLVYLEQRRREVKL